MSDDADLPNVLLRLAHEDDYAARSLLPVEGVADSILGFHAQQAVEKSLKAVLAYEGIEYPYSHDLDGFVELCNANGLDLPDELAGIDRLSEFAVRVRYGTGSPNVLDRDQALLWAGSAVTWAETIVESPPGPSSQPKTPEPADGE